VPYGCLSSGNRKAMPRYPVARYGVRSAGSLDLDSVIRLGNYSDPPFREAANSTRLLAAFDQLVGTGRWLPREGLGTFPVRFPADTDPGDTGWHVDASYPPYAAGQQNDYLEWRINIFSRGRALLMLFLFSDIGKCDAPTRIRVGSHRDVARMLGPYGEDGLSFIQLSKQLNLMPKRPEALATGGAGSVYLCHSLLAHAAQPHHGTEPRFMAQPPLEMKEAFHIERQNGDYSPAEVAIRIGLGMDGGQLRARHCLEDA
jgi:hypothetical protein